MDMADNQMSVMELSKEMCESAGFAASPPYPFIVAGSFWTHSHSPIATTIRHQSPNYEFVTFVGDNLSLGLLGDLSSSHE